MGVSWSLPIPDSNPSSSLWAQGLTFLSLGFLIVTNGDTNSTYLMDML